MSACYSPQWFKCGCFVRDTDSYGSNIIFTKCKKHRAELKKCSWLTWAKKFAPAQARKYIKDSR